MKVSDYIVEYLIEKGVSDVFGYPGGMVTHLMESFRIYENRIKAHVTYHEQGAAFAACGYAQVSGKPGVAYATSGPGATNLITGICNAFFDSIPTVFITGQVNTFEAKGTLGVRQRGFQETDIVSMVSSVTKYAAYVESPERIKYYLDRAFFEAASGRKGPVLLDIPMNIFRSDVDSMYLVGYSVDEKEETNIQIALGQVGKAINEAKHPCILLGNGVKISRNQKVARDVIEKLGIPVVSSMIAFDVIAGSRYSYGFVGAYGHRAANFIVAKSDLVISLGSRLDVRQVGAKRENFAPDAKIIRFDIDQGEMSNRVHENEEQYCMDVGKVLSLLDCIHLDKDYSEWIATCDQLRETLQGHDDRRPNCLVRGISKQISENTVITTDVGQNQVWIAQSFELKAGQEVLFSGGHGAMGYSLPAAIGACYAHDRKPIVSFNGDGGLQMNIQELQMIAREQLPIKIVVFNNNSLGMIRHFQEMYFDGNSFQTRPQGGYTAPEFTRIAEAYGIRTLKCRRVEEINQCPGWMDDKPLLAEVIIDEDTYVFPKLEFGKPNQDQEPLLDRTLYTRLMNLPN